MTYKNNLENVSKLLSRMAEALERIAPSYQFPDNLDKAEGFIWEAQLRKLQTIDEIERLPLSCLKGIKNAN